MQILRHTEQPIDPDDPWNADALQRQDTAKAITSILETASQPLVVSVSAQFGMGKTFFAQRWAADLRRANKVAFYVNAWATDYSSDPLVALLGCLKTALNDLEPIDSGHLSVQQTLKNVVRAVAPTVAKVAINSAVAIATLGAVKEATDTTQEIIAASAIKEAERILNERVEKFSKQARAQDEFKQELHKLRDTIFRHRPKTTSATQTDEKIYILIDELDRCWPTYALEFLEATKHLFNVAGVISSSS